MAGHASTGVARGGGKGERGFIWGLWGLHVERVGSHEVERGKRGAAQPR